mmetsp:Transcript_1924/g.1835  ORF Transcript_1924/g.1835 Transcript_1924/m.1835 type:complete len:143 (-) Transcript_1924:54-482(-)
MVRISKNLNRIVNAFQIIKLLKGLQGKYNKVSTKSSNQDQINERMMELLNELNSKMNKMQGDVTSQGYLIKQQSIRKSRERGLPSLDTSPIGYGRNIDGFSLIRPYKKYTEEINEIMKEADTMSIDRSRGSQKSHKYFEEKK